MFSLSLNNKPFFDAGYVVCVDYSVFPVLGSTTNFNHFPDKDELVNSVALISFELFFLIPNSHTSYIYSQMSESQHWCESIHPKPTEPLFPGLFPSPKRYFLCRIALEGITSSICGAPLAGRLSEVLRGFGSETSQSDAVKRREVQGFWWLALFGQRVWNLTTCFFLCLSSYICN